MRIFVAAVFGAVLLCWVPAVPAQEEIPKAIQEVLKQYEEEAADIEKLIDPGLQKKRDKAGDELKKIQDAFCKDGKLDEAVAIRDVIRNLQAGVNVEPGTDLPADARKVLKQYQKEESEVYEKAEADAKKCRGKIVAELQKLQDSFCRDAKLDEALATRDVIRSFLDGDKAALPDPGNLAPPETDIGKVFYYNVTGAINTGVIYGSNVYVPGSNLAVAAVHAGVLKDGQRGVVKVTVVAGRASYPGTTQNGVTSNAYNAALTVSYKVERAYGFLPKVGFGKALADPGTLTTYRGQNGKVYLFEVTGRADLSIAGTDIYTDDSALATAVVHAGVLRVGQSGIVRVTILPGQANYEGTTRHGVNSGASANYPGSYRVERVRVNRDLKLESKE
jgi:hypothetical protein